jgi:hypothetical protein
MLMRQDRLLIAPDHSSPVLLRSRRFRSQMYRAVMFLVTNGSSRQGEECFQRSARSLSDIAFVTRRRRCGQMRGRRPGKTGGVFA